MNEQVQGAEAESLIQRVEHAVEAALGIKQHADEASASPPTLSALDEVKELIAKVERGHWTSATLHELKDAAKRLVAHIEEVR